VPGSLSIWQTKIPPYFTRAIFGMQAIVAPCALLFPTPKANVNNDECWEGTYAGLVVFGSPL
jgi:hypothetical protein